MQDHPSSSMLPSHPPEAETWKAYWREQGQPWRSEPIIDEERQQQLLSYSQGASISSVGGIPSRAYG